MVYVEGQAERYVMEINQKDKCYYLSKWDGEFYLRNQDEEGMSLREEKLFALLDEFFEREF